MSDLNIQNDIKIVNLKRKKTFSTTKKSKDLEDPKIVRKNHQKLTQRDSSKPFKMDLDSKNQLNINSKKSKKKKSPNILISNLEINSFESIKHSLENITEIVINQEADILEAVMGCQQPNNYHVYGRMPDKQLSYIFKCREFSGCCMRFCCPVSLRQLSMKIKIAAQEQNENTEDEEFYDSIIDIKKKCKCPFLCLIRPDMKVILTHNNKILGTIEEGFSFCDPVFYIYDHNDNKIFYITTECCQCGFLCRNNFLGKTDEVHFFIYKSGGKDSPVGDICKKAAKSMFSIADNYSVILPNKATPEEKVLLTIAGIMIDYQYFEMNTNAK